MNRRNWIRSVAALPVTLSPAAAGRSNKVETEIVRLQLRHTWTTTMSSSEYRDNLYCRFDSDGITGVGEGAPIVRYNESARMAARAIESVRPMLATADPWKYRDVLEAVFARIEGQYAAKAALDIALMDWAGQKLGVPLYRMFGLDAADAPVTTFSIGIADPEETKQKVREAEPFPILKIKVGLEKDETTKEAVRQRRIQIERRSCPENQLAGVARGGIHRTAAAWGHAGGSPMGSEPGPYPGPGGRGLPASHRYT
jgi:L-alanine-DL-glutamate epimerase-like enolase superfamily enzyme